MLLRLLIALFVIVNFYSCKKEIYIYEKDLQEDKFYLQYKKSPYTGTCTILSSDSSRRVIGILNYKKGICEGKAIFFIQMVNQSVQVLIIMVIWMVYGNFGMKMVI